MCEAANFNSFNAVNSSRRGRPDSTDDPIIVPPQIALAGSATPRLADDLIAAQKPGIHFMMSDNPALPRIPKKPKLMDFLKNRFQPTVRNHLLQSAKLARDAGHGGKVVLACLLHDISLATLIRTDHGYWGAQIIEPYVDQEITWAVKFHQALRYFPDESVGYRYPEAYIGFFGAAYSPPDYIRHDYEVARNHRWYMTGRLITIYDIYAFEDDRDIDPEEFSDVIAEHFHEPEDGLGFDNSPVSHMWRSMIWPNNFL